jgi:FtsZ-binding cell division protein ZapB
MLEKEMSKKNSMAGQKTRQFQHDRNELFQYGVELWQKSHGWSENLV